MPALGRGDNLWVFFALGVDGAEDGGQAAFVTEIIICSRVLHEILAFLINCIVGQVHAEVVEIAAEWRDIVLRGEPRQALLVYENA